MPEVILNGPEGRLEGRYVHSKHPKAPAALILHPHSLYGGTMNNKVVYNIFQCFARKGFSTLRINFRGVGKSQGKYGDGAGELTDAATAMDWLQLHNHDAPNFWIAGFSFGAWIAMQLLMRRPEIQTFVAVSPPANKFDFSFLSPCPAPGLIVQGDNDSVVSEASVAELVNKLSKQKGADVNYQIINQADHFFREQIDTLNEVIEQYISQKISNITHKKPKTDRRKKQIISEENF